MLRKTIFWTHLVCGLATGVVVFMMSLTGVVLMYERQINQWAAEKYYVPAEQQGERLPLEQLLAMQRTTQPDVVPTTLVITSDPGAPVALRAGRAGGASLNPYTGEPMEAGSPGLDAFFSAVTGWHRWFNVQGDGRAFAREITGISNVVFLFLIISGVYLWLPSIWKWAMFKARLVFRKEYPDSKSRDFHWHHIFGIWAAVPLFFVVYTGAVISYPWAANLMYTVFGAEIPQPQGAGLGGGGGPGGGPGGGGPGAGPGRGAAPQQEGSAMISANYLPLSVLVDRAIAQANGEWERVNVTLPAASDPNVQVEIDPGNGAQAHKRYTLSLDRSTGDVVGTRTFADQPEATRLRGISRFLHTGEVLGFWGQTIAGLASFAALFGVWTGFALSYRRLIQPLFRKK
ncbi:MAG TPA: PepSY-associated TM helix domain-containing protein [Pseudomonadales bacterium]